MKCNRVDERCVNLRLSNNMSSKQLQAKMITNRKMIPYQNTTIQHIYNTILNTTYDDNYNLSLILGVDVYKYYWNTLFNSHNIHNSKKMKLMEYRLFAYPIVYDIRFPTFNVDTFVVSDKVYIYGDLFENKINGMSVNFGDIPMVVYGNRIEILNVNNVIHNTILLKNKHNINISLSITFHKQTTYMYESGQVSYYVYSCNSGIYGGTTETYLSTLIINDLLSWQSYIDRNITHVLIREGTRINMRCSVSKETNIELNKTNQINSNIQAYVENERLYINKTIITINDLSITNLNVINITNEHGVRVSLSLYMSRDVFQNYKLPNWIFILTGQFTYEMDVLDVSNLDSWETYLNYTSI